MSFKEIQLDISFSQYCKKNYKAVQYWLETGWTPEEIADNKIINRSGKYTVWRGVAMTQGSSPALVICQRLRDQVS